MIDFGIPGDSRKLRKRVFTELITPDEETGYRDGADDAKLLAPFVEDEHPSLETRLWMAFLYGTSYSCTTTLRFIQEFPTVADVTHNKATRFWSKKKESLWYQPDKKYLKNNDQVIPAIESIYQLSDKNLSKYLIPLLKQGFDATYKEITRSWKFFGPSGAYLFFDAIYALCPELYSDPVALDWKHCGRTVPEGMAHLLGEDEQALGQKPFDLSRYDKMVKVLSDRFDCPKILIESDLCFFRKLFKGTRYLGFYADRQMLECMSTAKNLHKECGIDIWSYRQRIIPEKFRGEVGGWEGIRKDRYKLFLSTGCLTEGDDLVE